jgi:hypothetical protein
VSIAPEPIPVAGVDGGTETWTANPDGRYPVCGCDSPQLGETRWDWMVCRVCGLPELAAMLRGPLGATP